MVKTAPERRDGECLHCQGLGLIYPAKSVKYSQWNGKLDSLPTPARALPLPCMFCEAGAIEGRVWDDLQARGVDGAELEIRAFRKAKG